MGTVSLISLLGICSWDDVKRKRISFIPVLVFGIIGLFLHLFRYERNILDILGGIFIGLVLFGISILSREKIGKGDALLIMVTGVYLGFWNNLLLLWISSFFAGVSGLVLICMGKGKRIIPFVPYVLIAYVLMLFFGGEGLAF